MSFNKGKVVFIGDANTGKTSLVQRMQTNKFVGTSSMFGTSFSVIKNDDRKIYLQCWDVDGQDRFIKFVPNYLKNADIVVICICEPNWIEELYSYQDIMIEQCPNAYVFFCITKMELFSNEHIEKIKTDVQTFASKYYNNYEILTVSSKTGEGVFELLESLYNITLDTPTINSKTNNLKGRCVII